MEAKSLEAELRQEVGIQCPEVDTMEEREISGTGASEEVKAWDEDYEGGSDEGTTTSGEDINRPDEDTERDDNISNGEKYVDRDVVRGGGGSEADKWDSSIIDGNEDKESLEA